MINKTPKFDNALDEVLDKIVPHSRECIQHSISKYCEETFQITDEDIKFFKILRVPPPKKCSTCRRQNRFAFVNSIDLYKRNNNAPEKNDKIISFVPPVSSLIVYDLKSYQNKFDPYLYATNYKENRNFFEQLLELRLKVPQPAIIRDPSNVNSEYSQNGRNLKNGYYVSGGWNSEDVWYSKGVSDSRLVMDIFSSHFIENSYELISCEKCYNCRYLYFSDNCIDSQFLYDCNNCINCFGCVNLRNKNNCIWNIQYTKGEYKNQISKINFGSRNFVKQIKENFWKFVKSHPVRAERHERVENVSGVNISDSKNCHDAIDVVSTEHVLHCDQVIGHKDSMDASISGGSEKLYQTIGVGSKSANVKFSFASKFILESEFVINCRNIEYCFACIGLENKSYCIFNRQYEKEKYYKELDNIKLSLLEKGEYGEFFPYSMSTFAYNGSLAELAFPLNETEIIKIGGSWQPDTDTDTLDMFILPTEEIPDSILDVKDEILTKALICRETGRPFRIVNSELEFYRNYNIPLPDVHPNKRMKNRYNYMGNYRAYDNICSLCQKNIKTMYNSNNDWKLYCDDCYKKEIL